NSCESFQDTFSTGKRFRSASAMSLTAFLLAPWREKPLAFTPGTFCSWRKRLAASGPDTTTLAPAFAPVRVVPDPTAEVVLPKGYHWVAGSPASYIGISLTLGPGEHRAGRRYV